jgi:amidohydrolase
LLAEYDALPKIGHGCGHNLIAAASLGAGVALKRCPAITPGQIAIVGTPAEEGGGGKVFLCNAGVFNAMDAAMMFHPGRSNIAGKAMLGRIKFDLEFFGKAAHASGSPDQGINALDALIGTFNHINALRQQLAADARIHGIITHGGDAPNVTPDYAAGLFYVRAMKKKYRDLLLKRVEKCARGAALAAGARFKIQVHDPKLDPMKRNQPLETAVKKNMRLLGLTLDREDANTGSSDMGNLSWHLPAIHPYLAIVDANVPSHSAAFAEATNTPRGQAALINAAKMLAMTAYDFLTSHDLQQRTAAAFHT